MYSCVLCCESRAVHVFINGGWKIRCDRLQICILSPSSSGKPGKRQPPVMVPHRQVSFADVIQSQEMEREDQRRYCGSSSHVPSAGNKTQLCIRAVCYPISLPEQ